MFSPQMSKKSLAVWFEQFPSAQSITASVMFTLRVFSVPACVPQNPGVRQIASAHSGGAGWVVTCTHPFTGSQLSVVQASWSSQKSAGFGVFTHPVAGLQLSSVHALLSLHDAEMSVCTHPTAGSHLSAVHALLSLQKSAGFGVFTHPVAGLQLSSVHALLSLHDAEMSVCTHPTAGSHLSAVHALLSLHDAEMSVCTHPI